MTTDVTQAEALKAWWENTAFNGKEYCELKDNGDLILRKTAEHPEKVLASLSIEHAAASVKALTEKFPEVEARVKELRDEWDQTEDKIKLIGKVSRVKDYLLHTNAIGDFSTLLAGVGDYERVIRGITEDNYKQKLALVEKAERLAAENQNWKETAQEFKDISEQWRSIGHVEKHQNDELWARLEEARTRFYDRKRHHQEEQEKEQLQNLDLKLEIVDKAEQHAASEDWKDTTELFRQLMDQWKTVGRTMPDKNEELWSRFIMAMNSFFERKRVHFESIKAEQEKNYELKAALVERAEQLKESTEWNKTTQAYASLMDEWKKIGKVPIEKSDEIWKRLNAAKDFFFDNKRQHTETLKVSWNDNYAQKIALLKRAEELKHSDQWREATEEMNELMEEWKKIGPVPREHMNTIWEQFISARRFFFDRKDADRERRKQQFERQLNQKNEKVRTFLQQLEAELKEEQEKLVDFQNAVENITPGNKAEELRAHLDKLIRQCETKIKHKEEKIADIRKQAEELEGKKKKDAGKKEEPSTPES